MRVQDNADRLGAISINDRREFPLAAQAVKVNEQALSGRSAPKVPPEMARKAEEAGTVKANLGARRMFALAVLAAGYIGMAAFLSRQRRVVNFERIDTASTEPLGFVDERLGVHGVRSVEVARFPSQPLTATNRPQSEV